jgi:hypothetical protein
MSNGKGCRCNAHCEHECICDADWTTKEVYDLRAENADLKDRIATALLDKAAVERGVMRLRAELAQRIAERDEARREVCNLSGGFDVKQSRRVADARGWDCFDAKEVQP